MRNMFCGLLGLAACQVSTSAQAQASGDWNIASAQGYLEHIVSNGPGNSFNISCNVSADPNTIGKASIFVEIVGKSPEPHSYVDIFAIDDVLQAACERQGVYRN